MGLNLGWVYLFMGVVIGSAVIPLWNMMTWDKASGKVRPFTIFLSLHLSSEVNPHFYVSKSDPTSSLTFISLT